MTQHASPAIRLRLLGTPAIEGPDGPLQARGARGSRLALMALLATARGRPLTRDKVLSVLWPDVDTDRGRRQLSDALYLLRGSVGDDAVVSSGDDLRLDRERIGSDVEAFEQLLDEGEAERAVGLYAGPFLDGFHLDDAAEFERWQDSERTRLDHRFADALKALADASERRDDWPAAVGWLRRLAAHEPYSGGTAARLMRALVANGDRAAALQHARVYATLLRNEFDADPDAEVVELAERLKAETVRDVSVSPPAVSRAVPELAPTPAGEPVMPAAAPAAVPADAMPTDQSAASAHETRQSVDGPRRPSPRSSRRAAAFISLSVLVAVAAVWIGRTVTTRTGSADGMVPDGTPRRSIAVLPFSDLSQGEDERYFSDGLTEEVIGLLSRVEGLRVAARTSSFALRDAGLDARAMGDTLRVATLLEGSVRRTGDRVRVNAQLVDAAQGYQIWSRSYDRRMEDVIALQNDIASAIVAALKLRLAEPRAQAAEHAQANPEAYDLYLRGIYTRNKLTGDALRKANDYFDRALRLDSLYAPAYAGKATTVSPMVWFGHLPREQGAPMIRAAAQRAVELDETLDEAHIGLGMIAFFFDWDWPTAEREFRRATEVNPNSAHAHHFLANFLKAMGRFDEAIIERRIALELDPLSVRTGMLLGADYFATGEYELAAEQYARASEIDPSAPLVIGEGPGVDMGLGHAYERLGRNADAMREHLRIDSLSGVGPLALVQLRQAFDRGGIRGYWRARVEMMERNSSVRADPVRLAWMWARAGNVPEAVRALERAHNERSLGLVFLRVVPDFVALRSEPRVRAILTAMRLETPADR